MSEFLIEKRVQFTNHIVVKALKTKRYLIVNGMYNAFVQN